MVKFIICKTKKKGLDTRKFSSGNLLFTVQQSSIQVWVFSNFKIRFLKVKAPDCLYSLS